MKRMRRIFSAVSGLLVAVGFLCMWSGCVKQPSKVEVIVTFLAILELMKMGKIVISQEHIFDDIKIDSKIAA